MSGTTETKRYYLSGEISANTDVFIVASDADKVLYYLTLIKNETEGVDDLVFDPRIDSVTLEPINESLCIKASPSGCGMVMSYTDDEDKKSWIGSTFHDNKRIAINKSSADVLLFVNNVINSGFVTTGIEYEIHTQGNKLIEWKAFFPDLSSKENGVVTDVAADFDIKTNYLKKIRFVPKVIHHTDTCQTQLEPMEVITNESKWFHGSDDVVEGFPDEESAADAVKSSPCTAGTFCGDGNCKGPCPNLGEDCILGTDGETYLCQASGNPKSASQFMSDNNGWVWIAIGILLALLAAMIVSQMF